MDNLVKRLRGLADCDARSGEPLGKCMREAADEIERLRVNLDAVQRVLLTRFARSAPIEEALMAIGVGKRDLPTREECAAWAVKLGVPDKGNGK